MRAEEWLRARAGGAPAGLLRVMIEAVPESEAAIPDVLAEGALRLYSRVLAGSGGRDDALPLLAADALFTHAFQAQAEIAPEGIADFSARWGGQGRLAELLR